MVETSDNNKIVIIHFEFRNCRDNNKINACNINAFT